MRKHRCLCSCGSDWWECNQQSHFHFWELSICVLEPKKGGWKVTPELICFSTVNPHSRKTTSNTYNSRLLWRRHTHRKIGPLIVQWLIIRVSVWCVLADLCLDSKCPPFFPALLPLDICSFFYSFVCFHHLLSLLYYSANHMLPHHVLFHCWVQNYL